MDCLKTTFLGTYCGLRHGVADVNYAVFSPYPGSEIFEKLRKEKKINMDDNYLKSLMSYQDVTLTSSYCEKVSGRMLSIIRIVGYALSYMSIYISRPSRIYKFFKLFFQKDFSPANLFEQRIYDYLIRLKLNRKSKKITANN